MCKINANFLFSGLNYFMNGVGGTFRWSSASDPWQDIIFRSRQGELCIREQVPNNYSGTDTRCLVCSWMSTSLLDIHTNRSCSNSTVCVFTFIAIDALSVMSCQLIIQIQIVKPPNTNCKRSETFQNLNAWNMVWCYVVWYHVERYHVVW